MGPSVMVWDVKGKIKSQYDEHTLIGWKNQILN
jgi:hypothetical protein